MCASRLKRWNRREGWESLPLNADPDRLMDKCVFCIKKCNKVYVRSSIYEKRGVTDGWSIPSEKRDYDEIEQVNDSSQ
jgi:hypothetical protein